MKILFKQANPSESLQKITLLEQLGFSGCYFKLVRPAQDARTITPRPHHHTCCELHLVTKGVQHYEIDGKTYWVTAGSVILIPPNVSHQHLFSAVDTEKYSVTFGSVSPAPTHLMAHLCSQVLCMPLCPQAREAVEAIEQETKRRREYSSAVLECRIFQLLLALARASGFQEETPPEQEAEDPRVSMARQYVQDNIDRPITCPELADYCHLSQKQLTRLFLQSTAMTPGAYIRSQKILRIEQLLSESDLSLKGISDLLHFASESHFNSFFTKYAGMTPGAYRKMNNRSAQ